MLRSRLRFPLTLALAIACSLAACDDAGLSDAGLSDARVDSSVGVDAGNAPDDFDGFVEWHMAAGGIPGAAMAIVTPDAIQLIEGYGFGDVESGRAIDAHSLFVVASVSKTLAVTRVMQLVESGALDLDADVNTYLPFTFANPAYPSELITTRMLLSHVSGLSDNFGSLGMYFTFVDDPPVTLSEFSFDYASPTGAHFEESHWDQAPLAQHDYCNAAFGVIGHIIEEAGGETFRNQTESGLFVPLAMDDAGWFLADVDLSRLATPYSWNGRDFVALPQNGFAYFPASSLRVSITGLARFARALLRGGELDGTRVLEQASVDEMLRIQYPALDSGQALTFSERRISGDRYIGHSGSTFGGSAQLRLSREGTHAIVLLTNSDAYIRDRLGLTEGRDAMEAILRRLDEDARSL